MEILSDYKMLHFDFSGSAIRNTTKDLFVIVVTYCLEYESRKKIIHLDQFCSILDVY